MLHEASNSSSTSAAAQPGGAGISTAPAVDLSAPTPADLQMARLQQVRRRALQLLSDKYHRDDMEGTPVQRAARRYDACAQLQSRLERLAAPLSFDAAVAPLKAALEDGVSATDLLRSHASLQYAEHSTEEDVARAEAAVRTAALALSVDRPWWLVFSPDTASAVDIRQTCVPWPWADDTDAVPLNPHTPGWRGVAKAADWLPRSAHTAGTGDRGSNTRARGGDDGAPAAFATPLCDLLQVAGAPAVAAALADTPLLRAVGDQTYDVGDLFPPVDAITAQPSANAAGSGTPACTDDAASAWWLAYTQQQPPHYTARLRTLEACAAQSLKPTPSTSQLGGTPPSGEV
ncbi:hypothetical protein EON68_04415, partial [archaeon]